MPDFSSQLLLLNGRFATSLAIDVTCAIILARFIYYRYYRRSDLFLTFFSFNIVIFLIAYSLNRVEMTLGAAFGLFAVFSMLRYRTEDISPKDMTYIFLFIALGLLMAIAGGAWVEKAVIATLMLLATALLESNLLVRRELTQEVWYDRVDLVQAGARAELLQDLEGRTGLRIHRVEVRQIDLLRDAARLTLYHYAS